MTENTLSWDDERLNSPERPSVGANLAEATAVERPRRVTAALWLGFAGFVGALVVTVMGSLNLAELRSAMLDSLPADLTEGYEPADLERAITLLFVSVWALALIFALAIVLSLRSVSVKRSQVARVLSVLLTVVYVFAALFALIFREAGPVDMTITVLSFTLCVAAVSCVCTPAVTQWLQHTPPTRTISLTHTADNAESPSATTSER